MYKCTDCGKELKVIYYVRPVEYQTYTMAEGRDPLCNSCWKKAIKKFETEHK